jgi:hypothetical protein
MAKPEKHRHLYGPWTIKKVGRHADLADKEYAMATRFPPFWSKSCECGAENMYRSRKRPLARMNFREMWGAKVL